MSIGILPLDSKHYSTRIEAYLPDGEFIGVEVFGYNHKPSTREIEHGWDPDEGMDHVEGDKVYSVALKIRELLEELYG